VVFQPHRYSRTAALAEEFGACFADAARVWVLDIYAAGEKPMPGVTAERIVEAAHRAGAKHVEHAPDQGAVVEAIAREARPGDRVFTLGAGDVWRLADRVLEQLRKSTAVGGGTR